MGFGKWVERAGFYEPLAFNALIIPQGAGDAASDTEEVV
jgi:hypothetical protein